MKYLFRLHEDDVTNYYDRYIDLVYNFVLFLFDIDLISI